MENNDIYTFELPFPPTVNTYYRYVNGRGVKSRAARSYYDNAGKHLMIQKRPSEALTGHLGAYVEYSPPDRRVRDMDNHGKGVFDSLVGWKIIEDDSLFKVKVEFWNKPIKNGLVKISIMSAEHLREKLRHIM